MVFFFDALSLGALFDLGAWDELLQMADDIVRRSQQVGGQYAPALAQPWITQVLLWRDRHAEASEDGWRPCASESMQIRDAQVLVPAWVATALVAIREDRREDAIGIIEELDRETEVSLDWYRENFLADLVRVCTASGALPLARRLIDRSHATAKRHHLSLLSATASLEEALGHDAEAAGLYERAVTGWKDYDHQLETGIGAPRCEPLPRAARRPRSPDRRSRAEEIFAGLQAQPAVGETTSDPR